MLRYILVSLGGGLLFGVMDGIINANPLAQQLFQVYRPMARASVNAPVGILIDLIYGFIMAGVFILLYRSLPGESGLVKGVSFGLLAWFLRVVMGAVSQWMTYTVPAQTVVYQVGAGLIEMLVLGVLFGLTLRPAN